MNRKLILTISALFCASALTAQWQPANGPYGGFVYSLLYQNGRLLAGGSGAGLWYSEDFGNNWTCSQSLTNGTIYSIASIGDTIFTGSTANCHYSADHGTTFTSYARGITGNLSFKSLYPSGSRLFAATDAGVYKSTGRNADWMLMTGGLSMQRFLSLAVLADTIFAGSEDGLYISRDGGSSWSSSYTGLTNVELWWYRAVIVKDSLVLTGHSRGISKSIDGGRTWIQSDTGLASLNVQSLYRTGSRIYAGTSRGGVFVSDNDGDTWQPASQSIGNNTIYCFVGSQNAVFAGTENGVNRLENGSDDWLPVLNGFDGSYISALAAEGTTLLAGNYGGSLMVTTSGGDSWNPVSAGLNQTTIYNISFCNTAIYVGCWEGLFRSTDRCGSWSEVSFNLPDPVHVYSFLQKDGILYAGTLREGVLVSDDNGNTWTARNNGLIINPVRALVTRGNRIFAATYNGGVYASDDAGLNWVEVNDGLAEKRVYSLMVKDSTLMAGTYQGFYFLDLKGNRWVQSQTGPVIPRGYGFAHDGAHLFAATNRGVFFSTDEGRTWTQNNTGLLNTNVQNVAVAGNTLYAGTGGRGVWKCPVYFVLGTDESQISLTNLKLYPNPVSGTLHITCPAVAGTTSRLEITGITGRMVLSEEFKGERTLDVTRWKAGVYWIRITGQEGALVGKVVVE